MFIVLQKFNCKCGWQALWKHLEHIEKVFWKDSWVIVCHICLNCKDLSIFLSLRCWMSLLRKVRLQCEILDHLSSYPTGKFLWISNKTIQSNLLWEQRIHIPWTSNGHISIGIIKGGINNRRECEIVYSFCMFTSQCWCYKLT